MILWPDFSQITTEGLYNKRRALLMREPHGLHSITNCWNPECASCAQWKDWAKELREVNAQIEIRNQPNKKA